MLDTLAKKQATDSWFVGFMDGEGSFNNQARKYIDISNLNYNLIKKCSEFLNTYNVQHNISYCTRQNIKEYKLRICGIDNCYYLYKIINTKIDCRLSEFVNMLGSSVFDQTTLDGASTIIRKPSADLNWLIGIFESEGSLSLHENHYDYGRAISVNISMCNTNFRIIEKVVLTLKQLGCSWYIKDRFAEGNRKHLKIVLISGMKRCYRFLRKTRNMWMCERNIKRSNLMIEFIESRFSRSQKEPYNNREYQIFQIMRDLNKKNSRR